MKNFSIAFAVIFVLLVSGHLFAEVSNEVDVGDLLEASNITHLKFKLRERHHLETTRAQCHIQLKFEMLPVSCFEVIQIEKNRHILSDEKFEKTKLWLTENCIERARQTTQISKERIQLKLLPPTCREIVTEKLSDQEYRDVTMNPESLFERRL